VARIRALARRAAAPLPASLTFGDLSMDPAHRVAVRAGRRLPLTPKELAVFPHNPALTAIDSITVRPRTFSAAAGRLSPACPRRPPVTSCACPHLAARTRGARWARASGHGAGGEYLSLYGYRATDGR
jgi:hypothetical protein